MAAVWCVRFFYVFTWFGWGKRCIAAQNIYNIYSNMMLIIFCEVLLENKNIIFSCFFVFVCGCSDEVLYEGKEGKENTHVHTHRLLVYLLCRICSVY